MNDSFLQQSPVLAFEATEKGSLTLLEFTSFLYDITLVHDAYVLAYLKKGTEYRFGRRFWYRQGRPVPREKQLHLKSIKMSSPIGAEILVPAALALPGSLWCLVQLFEKIWNIRLRRRKTELEVEKLEREREKEKLQVLTEYERYKQAYLREEFYLREVGAMEYIEYLETRLSESRITITSVEIRLPRERELR